MKYILSILILFLTLKSQAVIYQNYWTTNANPLFLAGPQGGAISNKVIVMSGTPARFTNNTPYLLQVTIPYSFWGTNVVGINIDTNADGTYDRFAYSFSSVLGNNTVVYTNQVTADLQPGWVGIYTDLAAVSKTILIGYALLQYYTTNGASGSIGPADGATIIGLEVGAYKGPSSWMFTNAVWVDVTNGVDSLDNGTYAAPFASIGYAATNSPAAGVVLVKPGLYVESIQRVFGQKDYVLSKGTTIVGKTNAGPSSIISAYQGFTQLSVQTTNNFPVRIFGRGSLVAGNDAFPTVLIDNGALEIEAELIQNPNAAGYSIEFQGDDDDDNDSTIDVTVRNTVLASKVNIFPFQYGRPSLSQLYLQNVTILTTNSEPFQFDDFEAKEARAFKLVLDGVDSKSPQTNTLIDLGAGTRIFGTMLVQTNLPDGVAAYTYVQSFDTQVFANGIVGSGLGLTNLFYVDTIASTNGFFYYTTNSTTKRITANYVNTNSFGNGVGITNLTINNLTGPAGTPTVSTNVSAFTWNSTLTGLALGGGFGLASGAGVTLRSGSTDNRGVIDLYNGTSAGTGNTNIFVLNLSSNYPTAGFYSYQVACSNITTTANLIRLAEVTTSNILFQSVIAPASGSRYIITYTRLP